MTYPIFQVDVFTNEPFKGNPAAVVLLEDPKPAEWMQSVAFEMNLSETAFVHPQEEGFRLRWFTPAAEVDLCGHATLATSHILWETGKVKSEEKIRFATHSGWLSATKIEEFVELDFPSAPVKPEEVSEEYVKAIGGVPDFSWLSGDKWLLEFHDEKIVRNLKPDFQLLRQRSGRAVAVTARSDTPGIDFVSRYFAPWIGIDEDPVTGSAHCILGPYWSGKLHKNFLTGLQVSARGGLVRVRVSGERTYISGQAITIFKGELLA